MITRSLARRPRLAYIGRAQFSTEGPRPEEGKVDAAVDKQNKRFNKLLTREVLPLVFLACSVVFYYQYKTQVQNAVLGNGRFGLEAMSPDDERFVAKKLAGLLKYRYSIGKQSLGSELIDVQLVQDLYDELRRHLVSVQMLPGAVGAAQDVVVFYSDKHELLILPNGAMYISECLVEDVLHAGGLEGLAFLLLHELSHLVKSDLRRNLILSTKFGDLRRQLFLFSN